MFPKVVIYKLKSEILAVSIVNDEQELKLALTQDSGGLVEVEVFEVQNKEQAYE